MNTPKRIAPKRILVVSTIVAVFVAIGVVLHVEWPKRLDKERSSSYQTPLTATSSLPEPILPELNCWPADDEFTAHLDDSEQLLENLRWKGTEPWAPVTTICLLILIAILPRTFRVLLLLGMGAHFYCPIMRRK